jgi:hypothetical protein
MSWGHQGRWKQMAYRWLSSKSRFVDGKSTWPSCHCQEMTLRCKLKATVELKKTFRCSTRCQKSLTGTISAIFYHCVQAFKAPTSVINHPNDGDGSITTNLHMTVSQEDIRERERARDVFVLWKNVKFQATNSKQIKVLMNGAKSQFHSSSLALIYASPQSSQHI